MPLDQAACTHVRDADIGFLLGIGLSLPVALCIYDK
jgi:hypothetical protein